MHAPSIIMCPKCGKSIADHCDKCGYRMPAQQRADLSAVYKMLGKVTPDGEKATGTPHVGGNDRAILKLANEIKQRKRDKLRARARTINRAALARVSKSDRKLWTLTSKQDVVQCQALITDPPYSVGRWAWQPRTVAELETFTRSWATQWNECGANYAVVWFSETYLWQAKQWLSESLTNYEYVQLLFAHITNNSLDLGPKRFRQNHELAFFFRRKGCTLPIIGHQRSSMIVEKPQTNYNGSQRRQHPCQQPVTTYADWLIPALTNPGDTIADPFAGSGTVGIAAVKLKRYYHGIETNKEFRQIADERIAKHGFEG